MSRNIRYVKTQSQSILTPSNQKSQQNATLCEKTILVFLILFILVFFVAPHWIAMFKSILHK